MYCRCSTFDIDKIKKHITFPALLQLKCDGSYREAIVLQNKQVTFFSRTRKTYKNPVLEKQMISLPSGSYIGEWTIGPANNPKTNRFEGNGLLNSKEPPYDKVIFTVWDYFPSILGQVNYIDRLKQLTEIIVNTPNIAVINSQTVNNIREALVLSRKLINAGLEGGVLKDYTYKFKDGTSNLQYKIKQYLEADMRITGFTQGTGKRKDYFGAIEFSNDDKTITGSCSGFSDKELKEINANRASYLNKIITVGFNDLIHQNGKYTLNHPRFLCVRNDKTTTDDLATVIANKTMSNTVKNSAL